MSATLELEAPVVPETTDIPRAAARLGIHTSKAYELARTEGRLHPDVPVIRIGRKFLVPVRALDRLLLADN
ncbi:MAG: hypothetical protein QM692_03430 [Thermomicrobiales bacterium]